MKKKVTSLDHEREKRGAPVESWRRQGIYALLVTKPKAGKVKPFPTRKPRA